MRITQRVARNLILRHWEKRQMARVVADREALEAVMDRVEQERGKAGQKKARKTNRITL